jgi:hypothetical protein
VTRMSAERRTIPAMFRGAVDEVPDRAWLRSDDGVLTYGSALERIERAASALREEGIGA